MRFSGYCSLHDMQGKYLKSSVEEGLLQKLVIVFYS